MNGYPSFYPRIALVAPSPGLFNNWSIQFRELRLGVDVLLIKIEWLFKWIYGLLSIVISMFSADEN